MSLNSLKEIAEKCVRCGMCQSVCPVFAELQKEATVARGKVTLINKLLSNEIRHSKKLSTYLLQCLGCGACSENCPNGVNADELILGSRALMVEERGLSFPKWLILRKILTSRHLLSTLLKTGSLAQALISRKVPKESGLHLRFSLPYLDKNRLIPSIANPFFLDRYPDGVEAKEGRKKIGLFAGCSINYLFPAIGESTFRLLTRHGCSVRIPKDQICCGLPAYGAGDMETARSLARRNIRAFSHPDIDQILVPCGSCFYFLKEGYLKLLPGEEDVESFSKKVAEPSIFFLSLIDFSNRGMDRLDQGQRLRLTYHDPCHLRRKMKIYREPRQLLKSLPGVEFIEMKQPNRCCGMAGSFNLAYYDLSQKIVQRKVEDVKLTKADAVITSCMGCMIQLKDGLYKNGMETGVVHLVEVLERGLDRHDSAPYE